MLLYFSERSVMNIKPVAIGAAVGVGAFALCAHARYKANQQTFNRKYESFKEFPETYREVFADSTSAFLFGGTNPSTGRSTGAILFYNSNEVDELIHILDQADLSEAPIDEITRICQAFVLSTMKV